MKIITNFQNKQKWNEFIAKNSFPANFLQSWEWGEFNKKILKNKITRLVLFDNNKLQMASIIIEKKMLFNKSFLYCPRGFVWNKNYMDKKYHGYEEIIKKIKKNYKNKIFLRINPPYEFKNYIDDFTKKIGFIKPEILTRLKEPEETWILGLNKPKEVLLKNMHYKTRYNIKLACRKKIIVRTSTEKTLEKDINIFYKLSKQSAERNKIHIYNKEYYKKLIKYFFKQNQNIKLKFYLAEFQNKPLSSIIVIYFGNTATYLHGASANEFRNLMPNYLIQWQAIKDAKNAGTKIYDFWGISESKKRWSGITRFKKGFGGEKITFEGNWDYVLDKRWYHIFKLLRMLKNIF